MKKLLFLLFLAQIYAPILMLGQINLTESQIKRMLNQEFSQVISGQSNNNLGNFASLNLTEAEVDFNGNILFGDHSVLGIKASGGVSEGLLPILSNTELNSNIKLDLQYNILSPRYHTYVEYNPKQVYLLRKDSLNRAGELELLKHKLTADTGDAANLQSLKDAQKLKNDTLKNLSAVYNQNVRGADKDANKLSPGELNAIHQRALKLLREVEALEQQIQVEAKKQQRVEQALFEEKARDIRSKYRKAIEKLDSSMLLWGYRISWFSIGYKFRNESFRLFQDTSLFSEQVSKHNSTSNELRLQYSIYNYTPVPFKSYYLSFGWAYKFSDNLDELSKSEFTEIVNYGPNPEDRFKTKKYAAYNKSEYKASQQSIRFFTDLYWFLNAKNAVSLHVYPEIQFGKKSSINNGIGVFMAFKGTKDKGSTVNGELYFESKDLFNSHEVEASWFKRSTLGLRFTFPIKFKTNP